jgi:hypothetical protein
MGYPALTYFGAIHSRKQNEISATVPTPPSQSAANHSKRCVNGRGLGLISVNDIRSQA